MNLRSRILRWLGRAQTCDVDIIAMAYRTNAEQRRRLLDVRTLEAKRDVIREDRKLHREHR